MSEKKWNMNTHMIEIKSAYEKLLSKTDELRGYL